MSDKVAFTSWESAVQWLRNQPDQHELVRAAYYDDPLRDAAERYRQSGEWQAIRAQLLSPAGSVLDIGAGRGIASYALAREGFDVTALEPDPSDLVGAGAIRSLASEARLPINVVEEFSERLPFADCSFDLAFARAVLHHTADLGAACKEFFRVLKPGGRFIAVREHVISRRGHLDAFLQAHPLHDLYGGENAFLLNEYIGAFRRAGFTVRSVLRPLQSPINYFPHSPESLREELVVRLGKIPGSRPILRSLLAPNPVFSSVLRILSVLDSRPGRLYSFFCDKPDAH